MSNQQQIDWEPAPGYVLIRPLDREDMDRRLPKKSTLEMPDDMQKVSDHTGIGEVIKCGDIRMDNDEKRVDWLGPVLRAGDLVAFMPYTDKMLEIDMRKYSLVGYRQIMSVLRKAPDGK